LHKAIEPPTEWWVVVMAIQAMVERIEKTFTAMQGLKTLVCEQRQLLTVLKHNLKARCNIQGPMTDEETEAFSLALTNDPSLGCKKGNYSVKKQEVVDSLDEVGGFVQLSMDALQESGDDRDMATNNNIVSTIANFSLQIVVGISKVCAERDNQNNSTQQLPPVLPLDLCSLFPRDFICCLEQQRIQLKQMFSDLKVEKIDNQFRNLRLAFREPSKFHQLIQNSQAGSVVQTFEQCWTPLRGEFHDLQSLWGHLKRTDGWFWYKFYVTQK
jgi:hypothetical protein